MPRVDTIVFLDFPRHDLPLARNRAISHTVGRHGLDLHEGCPEKIDL
jgi:hypothetical protein